MKIDKHIFKSSLASPLEVDKNDKISLTSSILEMDQKELKPSITSSKSDQSLNKKKVKTISKRKKTSKKKLNSKNKVRKEILK